MPMLRDWLVRRHFFVGTKINWAFTLFTNIVPENREWNFPFAFSGDDSNNKNSLLTMGNVCMEHFLCSLLLFIAILYALESISLEFVVFDHAESYEQQSKKGSLFPIGLFFRYLLYLKFHEIQAEWTSLAIWLLAIQMCLHEFVSTCDLANKRRNPTNAMHSTSETNALCDS